MNISITDLKSNTGKYVEMAENQDVYITKNGKVVAKLTNAKPDKVKSAKELFGILPSNVDLNAAREERLT